MSKDQAARIDRATKWAERAARENWTTERIAKFHMRAISAAVRKERERCLGAVNAEAVASMTEKRFVNPGNIITAINGGKR